MALSHLPSAIKKTLLNIWFSGDFLEEMSQRLCGEQDSLVVDVLDVLLPIAGYKMALILFGAEFNAIDACNACKNRNSKYHVEKPSL